MPRAELPGRPEDRRGCECCRWRSSLRGGGGGPPDTTRAPSRHQHLLALLLAPLLAPATRPDMLGPQLWLRTPRLPGSDRHS